MAGIGSPSFIVEVAVEKSDLFNAGNQRRPRVLSTSSSYRVRNFLDSGVNVSKCGVLKASERENFLGFSLNLEKMHPWRSTCVRAISKNAAEGDSDDEPDDALQATIEKSKKVLAMQKELLQQISERKKLVSSIKNSLMETKDDLIPHNESNDSLGKFDLASTTGDEGDVDNGSKITPGSYAPPTPDEVAVSDNGEKDLRRNLPLEEVIPDLDLQRKFKTTNSDVFQSATVSPHLPKTSESFISECDKRVELAVNDVTGADGTPECEDVKPPPLAGANVMNIILVAAECTPWSKTGGLGDVAGALPKALARRGHRVMVVAPRYGEYAEARHIGARRQYNVHGQDVEVNYYHAFIDGVDFVFIDCHLFRHIEKNIYGGQREVPWYVPCGGVCYGDGNLVFIANDWHTALLPVYLKAYYRDNGLMSYTRSVLVIHNIAHQGRGPVSDFSIVDLPGHYIDLFKLYDPVGGDHFNIFAAGLKAADRVVTVSHGYAWELKTQEGGWGLNGIINENDWKLKGIVNGIDTKEWNPQLDVHLTSDGYTNYSLETLKVGKSQCKRALQKELGLPARKDVPLIGFIGRLDHQKGVDLIAEAIPWMVDQDMQLVMLGTGRPDLEDLLRQSENQYHDKVRGWVGFSVKMAHRITAGVDILLMPSRFEPCGLNQLYAMNYGTIPVVHGVGGLRDTVQPFDPYTESGLGWTFDRAETDRLIHALGNCLLTYREYKESWEGIQRRGMMQDLSWDNAAQNYEEVLVAAKYHW